MASRKETADLLKKAAVGYLVKRGFSAHFELGLNRRGRLKADVFGFNTKREFVICEVKSCWSDFSADAKWTSYLPYCHRLLFVLSERTFESRKDDFLDRLLGTGAGVLVLNSTTGHLESRKSCKRRQDLTEDKILDILTRIAFRNGFHRGNTRRTRLYL